MSAGHAGSGARKALATAVALVLVLALSACRAAGTAPAALPFPLVLEFTGEESVDEGRLAEIVRAELARLEVTELDKAAVDDAAFALELFYRARGHADARVDYEFVPDAAAPTARFQIHEGALVRVRSLVIEGPQALPTATVRGYLEPAASGGVYDEQRLADELATLRADYVARGFLRVAIEPVEIEFDEPRTSVALKVVLHEGPAFVVRAIDVLGGVAALAKVEGSLAETYVNKPYLLGVAPAIEQTLTEAYRRHGYPDVAAHVTALQDGTSGDTRVSVRLEPGERVTIAHFRLQGNARTRDATVLAFLGLENGEVYDSDRVRDAFRTLYATGLFESVALELEGQGPERTLVVTLVEARSVEIRIEPGFGSYEGPRVLLGIEEKNFQGRGRTVQLEGTLSLKARTVRATLIDRDFLGTPFTSETTAYVEQREEPSYEFVRRGLGFFLRRSWNERWSSSMGYEFRPTNVTDDDLNTPLAPDITNDSDVAALSASVGFDGRDSLLLPTRGGLARGRLEWADDGLGSDTEFMRAQLEYTQLVRLGPTGVVAASAHTGVIAPFGNTDEIPVTERYFNGGENSVRSFDEDELLPPGRSGQPQGGEAATTLNLEFRREVYGNLTGALFFDAGNVSEEIQDYWNFAGFRYAVGAGLRYMLPIGPVRLDLGVNPNPRDDEDDYVLHFSVGFPF
jgi:outer membrane protein assembly complex protein YaeT